LLRHKSHVAVTLANAQERRQEKLGDSIFAEMRRIFDKGRELLKKFEADGDTRGAIVALREVRATLEAMDTMQSRVDEVKQGQIVINITRDPATPEICLPERPAPDRPTSSRVQIAVNRMKRSVRESILLSRGFS
jgi:hypothetical protein